MTKLSKVLRAPARLALTLATIAGCSGKGAPPPPLASSAAGAIDRGAVALVPTPPPAPPTPKGDAFLRGKLDLAHRTLVGDHYEVPIAGGGHAILTLDPALQARAEEVLAHADAPIGAVVVMRPDGALLAIAGSSKVDPTLAAEAVATQPWAPSASVFKVVTSAALVDAGVPPEERVCYHGGLRSIDASNLVDGKHDRACNTLAFAVARSQNAIVAKLAATHLDAKTLRRYAQAFGYTVVPDFALAATPSPAEIPDEPLEFARASAGFWHTALSPLGGALLADTIATGGLAVTPRLVDAVVGADGATHAVEVAPPRRALPEATAQAVARMMVGTVEFGTAWKAFHDRRHAFLGDVVVAGKTGSLSKGDLGYSWFVGFAPADHPRYVIAVALANAPLYQLKANVAARMVLEAAFPAR